MGKRSHQLFKDKAKNRVSDLEGMMSDLQSARKESRTEDISLLEEQVHQMLREWKAELNEPSPATSLLGDGIGSDLSSGIRRLLNIGEEEDDATSKLEEVLGLNPKPEPVDLPAAAHNDLGAAAVFPQEYYVNLELPENGFLGDGEYKNILPTGSHQDVTNSLLVPSHMDYQQFNMHQEMPPGHLNYQQFPMHHEYYIDADRQNGDTPHYQEFPHFSDLLSTINLPPSAFLGPKCALWDCQRPSQQYQDYCSNFHATLASSEGESAKPPVLRPGGIDLKDGPLFSSLAAKTLGKSVGIPECVGATSAKCPWNNPVFDLTFLEGESLREWLFFDKPRRAFESGNRKQRSLPDYHGRGWHESRKQVMKEFGGMKRSYYMDPQPLNNKELHLFEYEINNCDIWALYRLELKLVDAKKSGKGKAMSDPVVDLQQQMGRLNAENSLDSKRYAKGRAKASQKDVSVDTCSVSDAINQEEHDVKVYLASDQMAPTNEYPVYGPHLPYGYSIESLNNYYGP
ncbi:transcription factor VOZ1-like [Iris pallida]|uniref:Transcription factor VOZ1-like n=1 Tax=Iris pallida TaxID=29817 RepID=A0AAX6GVG2_IRIPA|nr:transcription factor VOZ1-like [Iris pallida]KAJ6850979.1 transcription factor VOZ1-like [Iris pallida]